MSTAPAPSSHAEIRQLPGPGPQVEHHPALRQAQEPDGATPCPPVSSASKEVQIRLYSDWVEVYYKDHLVERMERVRGEREANVNYRHVIGSLVHKPGAFARYRFREQLFPAMQFRLSL